MLKEDLHLATPPPHPSEAPIVNPNPLATTPQAATAGTKLSLLTIESRAIPTFNFKGFSEATLAGSSSSIADDGWGQEGVSLTEGWCRAEGKRCWRFAY